MDLEHNTERLGFGPHKNVFEHKYDEIHRREIVIVQNDFEKFWFFELGFALSQDVSVVFGELRHKIYSATERTEKTGGRRRLAVEPVSTM